LLCDVRALAMVSEKNEKWWINIQYWPKVTHAMKRASHVGCNAFKARIQRVLHRICYSNVAHMKRASSVQHPLVKISCQFMSHDRELVVCHGKSIAIRIFLAKLLKIWPEQCGWEWRGYIQYMPYLVSWRHRRYSTINAVPRQSFVIHSNGGWWQSMCLSEHTNNSLIRK
jgi:hypothetical protein